MVRRLHLCNFLSPCSNSVNESTDIKPRSLRFTWSMKTTSSRDPNEIMAEIKKVIKGILPQYFMVCWRSCVEAGENVSATKGGERRLEIEFPPSSALKHRASRAQNGLRLDSIERVSDLDGLKIASTLLRRCNLQTNWTWSGYYI